MPKITQAEAAKYLAQFGDDAQHTLGLSFSAVGGIMKLRSDQEYINGIFGALKAIRDGKTSFSSSSAGQGHHLNFTGSPEKFLEEAFAEDSRFMQMFNQYKGQSSTDKLNSIDVQKYGSQFKDIQAPFVALIKDLKQKIDSPAPVATAAPITPPQTSPQAAPAIKIYSAAVDAQGKNRVAIKFPSAEAKGQFKTKFREEAINSGATADQIDAFIANFSTVQGNNDTLYIEPSVGRRGLGTYVSSNSELSVNFGSNEVRDAFVKLTGIKAEHALMPEVGGGTNALYFERSKLPPTPDKNRNIQIPLQGSMLQEQPQELSALGARLATIASEVVPAPYPPTTIPLSTPSISAIKTAKEMILEKVHPQAANAVVGNDPKVSDAKVLKITFTNLSDAQAFAKTVTGRHDAGPSIDGNTVTLGSKRADFFLKKHKINQHPSGGGMMDKLQSETPPPSIPSAKRPSGR